MADLYFKAKKQLTRRIGANMIVAHPEHKDPTARYVSVPDSDSTRVQTDMLVQQGYLEKITQRTYRNALEGTERPSAGDVRTAQVRGEWPKVSATWSTERLVAEAARRKVDLKGETDRKKMIALLNKSAGDGEGTAADTSVGEDADSARASVAASTNDSTNHPPRVSPQNDVGDNGSVDRLAAGPAAGTTGVEADEDAAPTGGEGEGGGSSSSGGNGGSTSGGASGGGGTGS